MKKPRISSAQASTKTTQKVQRWIDLLSTLLAHSFPLTFVELAKGVPAYLTDGSVRDGAPSDTLKRMFERDKDELRSLGVPIESTSDDGEEESRYRLRHTDFYMPYLLVASLRGTAKPTKVDKYGYRSLPTLAFEPDELVAVAEGARRATQLGDAALAADVASAVRKLALDLPLASAAPTDTTRALPVRAKPDPATMETVSDALFHHKRLTMRYQALGADATATDRTVEPYGLFFLNGHWYVAARDVDKDALRNFRVSRIRDAAANAQKKGTPDYIIPKTFDLREHSRSRLAWELGDDDAVEAIVEVKGTTGAALAGAALGKAISGEPARRAFTVRRVDAFARWLLSFAGEVVPLSPPAVVAEYQRQADATCALYAEGRE